MIASFITYIDDNSWLELSFTSTEGTLTLNSITHHIDGEVEFNRVDGLYSIIRALVNNAKYNLALGRYSLYQAHKSVLEHVLKYLYSEDELKMLADEYHCCINGEIFYLDLADCLFSDEEEDLPY